MGGGFGTPKASRDGGLASRLTTTANASSPVMSPDGRLVAYFASYDSNPDLYVLGACGGSPRRITCEGRRGVVCAWLDGEHVLYASTAFSGLPDYRLAIVSIRTQHVEVVPLSQAAHGAVMGVAGSRTLFFVRLPAQGSATKRYKGGFIQTLWRFDMDASPLRPSTPLFTDDFTGTSKHPVVLGDRLYFLCDRDGTMNVWSCTGDGGDLRRHTRHIAYDVSALGSAGDALVYACGGDVFVLWPGSDGAGSGEQGTRLPLGIVSDLPFRREQIITRPLPFVTAAHVTPEGDGVVLTARGQVFLASTARCRPAVLPLSHAPGVRFRHARPVPRSQHVLALSDATGETELVLLPVDGSGVPRPLTGDGDVLKHAPVVSPDGRFAAYRDRKQRLWLVDLVTGEQHVVASTTSPVPADSDVNYKYANTDMCFSPSGSMLAFAQPADNDYLVVYVYHVAEGRLEAVTDDRTNSYSPSWSADESLLYFLSDRAFSSSTPNPFGLTAPGPYFDRQTVVLARAMTDEAVFPFAPSPFLDARPSVRGQLYRVPVQPGNYLRLYVGLQHLFLMQFNNQTQMRKSLAVVDIADRFVAADTEPVVAASDIESFELAANRKRALLRRADSLHLLEARLWSRADEDAGAVPLSSSTVRADPPAEWKQMFCEAWRFHRDMFYDPGMHGLDWPAVLHRYLPMLDRATCRNDLSALMREMLGELSALHVYVSDDTPPATRSTADAIGSLGAVFERTEQGDRVVRLLDGYDVGAGLQSPLRVVGVQPGHVITHVDGQSVLAVPSLAELMRGRAGGYVVLTVEHRGAASRVAVRALTPAQDADLRYDEWEVNCARRVAAADPDQQLAYVHLRAMGTADMAQWARCFFPSFQRAGLIVDVRHNRGGNIDSFVLQTLRREAWLFWKPRVGHVYWNMQRAFRGHIVVLCDSRTCSDGEAFCEGFRRFKLGPVFGQRTWGGGIWLDMQERLIDNGYATTAEFGAFGLDREWLIEGHGFVPDREVDNEPFDTARGGDAQLDAAVQYLLQRVREQPVVVPQPPPYPHKAFRYPAEAQE